ncbi:hypothetical protein F66182_2298 [Fusarium sp. NRRL 66182]|nr:hypothetical protein F66182_2298 [Fusarium sp. NRRL 66182]
MPGTPSSLGCNGCRRQKKKCDQAKPTCGRCKRVGLPCVGNGVKRWKFQSLQSQDLDPRLTPAPSRSPSNSRTKVTSSLVHILQVEDCRYDIRAFGGRFIPDLPSQIGSSPALDTLDALTSYGEALAATRKSILDDREPINMKMQMVSVMFICHYWVDRKKAEQHREMISVLFREAVMKKQLAEIENYVGGLTQLAVLTSYLNPQFELGPWFWEACDALGTPRPIKYHQGTFLSLEAGTLGEISVFMRSPKKNIYQLQCIYNIVQYEMPKIRQLLALSTMAAAAPDAPTMSIRVCGSYRLAYGILLSVTAVINHVLRIWDGDPTLIGDMQDCIDEAISLTQQCESARPYGAIFVPDFLAMVWAATDSYRDDEMAKILSDHEKDAIGADYLGHGMSIRKRLQAMAIQEDKDEQEPQLDFAAFLQDQAIEEDEDYQEAVSQCVIL